METIAQMSCNPSIGGIAKGHLVKEIDALGGVMPALPMPPGIHFKVLNRSKGPAVRATRTQNDKIAYRNFMKLFLGNDSRVLHRQAMADRDRHAGKAGSAGSGFSRRGNPDADAVDL